MVGGHFQLQPFALLGQALDMIGTVGIDGNVDIAAVGLHQVLLFYGPQFHQWVFFLEILAAGDGAKGDQRQRC